MEGLVITSADISRSACAGHIRRSSRRGWNANTKEPTPETEPNRFIYILKRFRRKPCPSTSEGLIGYANGTVRTTV